jgi:hypothetical protein
MEENESIVEETIVDNGETVGNAEVEQENVQDAQQEQSEEVVDTTTNSTQEVQSEESEPKSHSRMYTEEEYQRAINKIIARERGNKEKEINPLLATLKAVGFDGKTPQEVNQKLRQNYKDQGVNLPDYKENMSEREQKALAKLDADEVIELGEQAMQERFGELYRKYKENNISIREQEEMNLIGKAHSIRLAKKELLSVGADPNIVESDKFKKFAQRYADNVSVKEIYEDYKEKYGVKPSKPASAGSVKTTHSEAQTNYNEMSNEDFEKELQRVIGGI